MAMKLKNTKKKHYQPKEKTPVRKLNFPPVRVNHVF